MLWEENFKHDLVMVYGNFVRHIVTYVNFFFTCKRDQNNNSIGTKLFKYYIDITITNMGLLQLLDWT